jgi:hypothetical protein
MRMMSFLAAAASVAVMGFGSLAAAETVQSGYVGVEYNRFDFDTDIGDGEVDGWGLNAAAAFPVGGNLGMQLDATYDRAEVADEDEDTLAGTAHLFRRTDASLIGGYIGLGEVDNDAFYGAGVEGELYYTNWTIGGRAGWSSADDTDADGYDVQGRGRYFYGDNTFVQAGVAFNRVELDQGDDADAWTVGVSGEHQFATTPFSAFAGLSYSDADVVETTAVTVGVRMNFATSLKERDRSGASLASWTRNLF